MARPSKKNCDYFSHFSEHNRDLFYLERKYGTDGYYFFYILREFLCNCDDIYYQIVSENDADYLYKSFALDKSKVIEMLDDSADNGIIDHLLWYEANIIWQDDLSNILHHAWKGRKNPPPVKPQVGVENITKRTVSNPINSVSDSINTQRKEEDIRRNHTKTKNTIEKGDDKKINQPKPETSKNVRELFADAEEEQAETFTEYSKNLSNKLKRNSKNKEK
jgi:hypothetical protein